MYQSETYVNRLAIQLITQIGICIPNYTLALRLITCDFRIRHGQQPTSHISFSFRTSTKLLGNVKPVTTTS